MRGIDVARLALEHLTPDQAVTAVAIAKAESNWKVGAVGDVALQDDIWGPSLGLWQIRSIKSQSGSGATRDAERLLEAKFNARSMARISRGGTHWTPWSVYKSGAYRAHLNEALQAVRQALALTAQAEDIKRWITSRFHRGSDFSSLGVYNRRHIAGSTTWSQHAWGNAIDIMVQGDWTPRAPFGKGTEGQHRLDQIFQALVQARTLGTLPIGRIIWRTSSHWNHIHVEGRPERRGTPPHMPGDIQEDEVELTKSIQRALVKAGYDLGDFGPDGDGVDGVWGSATEAAFVKAITAGKLPDRFDATVVVK